jgi:glucose-1-phosphate thymidylyltransferase
MKGIVLAGGAGSRLYPATLVVNKQLLPVFDKPMIYYPISVLMLAGITEILIVTSPEFLVNYQRLFGDGSSIGLSIEYVVQPRPAGIPQAFTLGQQWIARKPVALILGDNIFFGNGLVDICRRVIARTTGAQRGATIFGYRVEDPRPYGVIGFDAHDRIDSLEEKPLVPKSNWAMTGLYVFDSRVCDYAATLKPSARGELEITALAQCYLDNGDLHVEQFGRGFAWLDTGTHDSLIEAAEFIRTIQQRQGIQIACLEEIAFHLGLIDGHQARALAGAMPNSPYSAAIISAVEGNKRGE